MEEFERMFGTQVNEEIRLRLLEEERKLRNKQPTAWTKTKYRAYANFKTKKKEEEIKKAVAKNTARALKAKASRKTKKTKKQ